MNNSGPYNNPQPYGYPQQQPVSNGQYSPYPQYPPQQPFGGQQSIPGQGAVGQYPGGPIGDSTHRRQLTREEMAILKECQSESFWRRSLPLAILGSFGVSAAFKYGYLKPRGAKFFHYATAIGVGYFMGKMLYIKPCMEKLKTLKNSPLYDALSRSDRRGEILQDMSQLPGLGGMPELHRDDHQTYPVDPYHQGPGSAPIEGQNIPPLPDSGRKTTYEELRQKNRAEYWRQQQNMHAPPQPVAPMAPQQNSGPYNPSYPAPHAGPNAYPQPPPQGPSWMHPNQNQPRDNSESRYGDDYRNRQAKYFDQSDVIHADERYPKSNHGKYDDKDFS